MPAASASMAMRIQDGEQSPLWVVTTDLLTSPGHPFDAPLNSLLDANDFDRFVEKKCHRFYVRSWDGRVRRQVATSVAARLDQPT